MIITVFNQKGGVGKTTTTINLGAGLARAGKSVLLIDMDGSQDLTIGTGLDEVEGAKTTTDMLSGEAVTPITTAGGYDVIPADLDLFAVDLSNPGTLKSALEPFGTKYDYILIDCPPVLSQASINALVSSEKVLIPMQAAYYSARGNIQLLKTVQEVQGRINPRLEVCGVLLTMYDQRTRYGRKIRDDTAGFFKDKLFNTFIRRNTKLEEAAGAGEDIFTYDSKSNGAADYQAFTDEFLKRV